jgi:hypothetical protein
MCGPVPDFYYCETVVGLFMWDAYPDDRTDLSLAIVTDHCQSVPGPSPAGHMTTFHFQIRDFRNRKGYIPVFISPWKSVAQLYSQALGSLFIAYWYPYGYAGGLLPLVLAYRVGNTASNIPSVLAEACLPRRCATLTVPSAHYTAPVFSDMSEQ